MSQKEKIILSLGLVAIFAAAGGVVGFLTREPRLTTSQSPTSTPSPSPTPPATATATPSPTPIWPDGFFEFVGSNRGTPAPVGIRWQKPEEFGCSYFTCWGLELISSRDCEYLTVSGALVDSKGRNVGSAMDQRSNVRAWQRTILNLTTTHDGPAELQLAEVDCF